MDSTSSSRATRTFNRRRSYKSATTELLAQSISGKSCPICLCVIEDRRAAVIIPCMHAYCTVCIRRWSNMKQNCPLCKVDFDSWFTKINLASQTFHKVKLPIEGNAVISSGLPFRRRRPLADQLRSIRRYREELNGSSSSRTRPLPWRRSFLEQRVEHPDDIAERVLRWRANIYEMRLQAVPIASRDCLAQKARECVDAKSAVLQRIEPWIRRELQAILGDPDPSVIVHVVTSLFSLAYVEKHGTFFRRWEVDPDFFEPLLPFLQERTKMFWHELRCFAESSFSMETYDRVVEYIRLSD